MLAGIDLELESGGYTLIAGPTGSGKSTLALALIGAVGTVTRAEATGSVRILGEEIAAAPATRRSELVAAVWQRPDVQLFRSTVLDEVRAALDHRLVPAAEGDARAREMLELVGLAHLPETRDPSLLSGGEQQRLALAAALAQDAPVLVLDEATSALDAPAVQRFGAAIDRARAERGITVVAVDHRPDAHRGRADRLVVIDGGRVVLDGSLEEIHLNHADALARLGVRSPSGSRAPSPSPSSSSPSSPSSETGAGAGAQAGAGADAGASAGADAGAQADAAAALRIERVSVALRGSALLEEVDAALPLGSVALVTGDNGVGKSTLLRVLAAELRATTGRVRPRARARVRAGIGAAPQRAADLLLTGTVREEVCSVLAQGRSGADAATLRLAAEVLDLAGLADFADAHPLRLSGGQRQRLAVALATAGRPAGDPALVLLDEPTSAQDRIGSGWVLDLIERGAENRVTLIATHDPESFAGIETHRIRLRRSRADSSRADSSRVDSSRVDSSRVDSSRAGPAEASK